MMPTGTQLVAPREARIEVHGSNGPIEEKISGVTVKDLVRDGILKLFVVGTYATARLTEYGERIAHCFRYID